MSEVSKKKDFPIFQRLINNKPLVYLDSAATSQKPLGVIEAVGHFYATHNANTHRGIYSLAEESTELLETTRTKVNSFLGGAKGNLVFTKNSTEALNIAALSTESTVLNKGDEILTSVMEHHSNLIPLQQLAKRTGAKLIVASDVGENLLNSINNKTRLVSITGMSNVLGTVPNISEISQAAHSVDAVVSVDGCQLAAHSPVDLKKLGCDLFSCSAHKMLGPTGVGVLWARDGLLEKRNPQLFGGNMIKEVSEQNATWADSPMRFEAGTPNVAGIAGFSAAIDYLDLIGMETIAKHEFSLANYAREKMAEINGLRILSDGNILSFVMDEIHPHGIATLLNTENVCVRAGHHCAMPLMKHLGVVATTRASFHIYNDKNDIDMMITGLKKARKVFG